MAFYFNIVSILNNQYKELVDFNITKTIKIDTRIRLAKHYECIYFFKHKC